MSANEVHKLWNGFGVDLQQALNSPSFLGLFLELLDNYPGIEMVLMDQEIIGGLRNHTPRSERCIGKVPEVKCHDCLGIGANCCSKNMAIFGIIRHYRYQGLVSFYVCALKMSFQFPDQVIGLLFCESTLDF